MKQTKQRGDAEIPPSNLDAERAALGSLILASDPSSGDPTILDDPTVWIGPAAYYNDRHRDIYKAVRELHEHGIPADVVTLSERLEATGTLDELGGTGYLLEVIQSVPHPQHAAYYATIVLEKWRARRAIEIASLLDAKARHPDDGLDFTTALEALQSLHDGGPAADVLAFTDFADLVKENLRIEFLVNDILPAGKHGFIAGPSKSCKTTIALLLAFAVATGRPFLDLFAVANPAPVLIVSSEAGRDAVQWFLGLCFQSSGLDPEDYRGMIHVETEIPDGGIRSAKVLAALKRHITRTGARLLILDPKYLLGIVSPDAMANLDAAGEELKAVARLSAETGCTIAIVDHTRKNRAIPAGEPITLEEINGAGGAANARWWLLLNRESPYDHDEHPGFDSLWMSTGGGLGMGHGGCWNVGIQVRTWRSHGEDSIEITVTPRSEAVQQVADERASKAQARESEKERRHRERVDERKSAILDALRSYHARGEAASKTAACQLARLRSDDRGEPWEALRAEGTIDHFRGINVTANRLDTLWYVAGEFTPPSLESKSGRTTPPGTTKTLVKAA